MAPLCKSLAIEVRKTLRPLALARAVLTGDPVSNRLFRSAALARQVDALIGQGGISHIVAFSGQMAQYLPARLDRKSNTSELQSLMRISYAVFCLKKKKNNKKNRQESNKISK